ncbi:hypothetical protein H8E88_19350 [candidate division KSB1 bacterium]|nr:hypothetical protein [candidate division KSB1 bacterium]
MNGTYSNTSIACKDVKALTIKDLRKALLLIRNIPCPFEALDAGLYQKGDVMFIPKRFEEYVSRENVLFYSYCKDIYFCKKEAISKLL